MHVDKTIITNKNFKKVKIKVFYNRTATVLKMREQTFKKLDNTTIVDILNNPIKYLPASNSGSSDINNSVWRHLSQKLTL